MQRSKTTLVITAIAAAVLAASSVAAADTQIEPTGAIPLFAISKSQNKNQVHYAIRLDPSCVPVGAAPVSVFWRMLEKGAANVEPLSSREAASFGIRAQRVVQRSVHGGQVHLELNGFPDRPIDVQASQHDGVCQATSTMPIAGGPAIVHDVFAKMKWPYFAVDYVLLSGFSLDGGRFVRERMNP